MLIDLKQTQHRRQPIHDLGVLQESGEQPAHGFTGIPWENAHYFQVTSRTRHTAYFLPPLNRASVTVSAVFSSKSIMISKGRHTTSSQK